MASDKQANAKVFTLNVAGNWSAFKPSATNGST
jgi:hypothetical protein